jgi:hypothetical protein
MRLLLILLAIIWGLGILDQGNRSSAKNKLGRISSFTWHSADARSLTKDLNSGQNISNFLGEEDGDEEDGEEDGEDDEDDRWSVPHQSNEYDFSFNFSALRTSFSLFIRVADAHLGSPFNPPDVVLKNSY